MARTTIKDLELRIEKLERMIEKLLKRSKYDYNPQAKKKCPCCGQVVWNPFDKWGGFE